MIELNTVNFQTATNQLTKSANALSSVKNQKPELTCNSVPLKQYIECFHEMQELMKEYCNLLKVDSERIRSAGEAFKLAEQNLLVSPGR